MDKKELVQLLNDLFIPLDFKRKGNNWVCNGTELSKVINLQKSNFSNAYYINYGFIIKELQLTTTTHLEYRLGDTNKVKGLRIRDLLDIEKHVNLEERLFELRQIISEKIIDRFNLINNEAELLDEIKKLPYSSMVPGVVKKHFNLEKSW